VASASGRRGRLLPRVAPAERLAGRLASVWKWLPFSRAVMMSQIVRWQLTNVREGFLGILDRIGAIPVPL
jgi:hypothetical protein